MAKWPYSCYSTGSTRPDCNWTTKFRSQRTSHMEPSARALRTPDLSESVFKRALTTHLFSTARRHWDDFIILAPDINIQTYLLTYSTSLLHCMIWWYRRGVDYRILLSVMSEHVAAPDNALSRFSCYLFSPTVHNGLCLPGDTLKQFCSRLEVSVLELVSLSHRRYCSSFGDILSHLYANDNSTPAADLKTVTASANSSLELHRWRWTVVCHSSSPVERWQNLTSGLTADNNENIKYSR